MRGTESEPSGPTTIRLSVNCKIRTRQRLDLRYRGGVKTGFRVLRFRDMCRTILKIYRLLPNCEQNLQNNRRETGAVRVPAISITKEHTQRCGDQPTKQIPQRNFIVLFDKASEGGAAFAVESWHGGGTKQMGANARSHFMHPIPDLLGASATARLHSPQLHEETTARRSLKLRNFVWKRARVERKITNETNTRRSTRPRKAFSAYAEAKAFLQNSSR